MDLFENKMVPLKGRYFIAEQSFQGLTIYETHPTSGKFDGRIWNAHGVLPKNQEEVIAMDCMNQIVENDLPSGTMIRFSNDNQLNHPNE